MAERKIDYFGSFLESVRSPPRISTAEEAAPPRAAGNPDALNEMLKALRAGARTAKDLIPLTGNSPAEFLKLCDQLLGLGWVRRVDGDGVELTPKGREVAALLP